MLAAASTTHSRLSGGAAGSAAGVRTAPAEQVGVHAGVEEDAWPRPARGVPRAGP